MVQKLFELDTYKLLGLSTAFCDYRLELRALSLLFVWLRHH